MQRRNVRSQLRVIVKRILRKYGYPPEKQEKATQTVLEQAATAGSWLSIRPVLQLMMICLDEAMMESAKSLGMGVVTV